MKSVYIVIPDRLGWAFVAESEEKAREYAKKHMDFVEDSECFQVKDDEGKPVTLSEKDFGYKVPLREGLLKGIYSWVEADLECDNCDDPTGFFEEHDGKVICDKCKAQLEGSQ